MFETKDNGHSTVAECACGAGLGEILYLRASGPLQRPEVWVANNFACPAGGKVVITNDGEHRPVAE